MQIIGIHSQPGKVENDEQCEKPIERYSLYDIIQNWYSQRQTISHSTLLQSYNDNITTHHGD